MAFIWTEPHRLYVAGPLYTGLAPHTLADEMNNLEVAIGDQFRAAEEIMADEQRAYPGDSSLANSLGNDRIEQRDHLQDDVGMGLAAAICPPLLLLVIATLAKWLYRGFRPAS